jgi:hypothetical protein
MASRDIQSVAQDMIDSNRDGLEKATGAKVLDPQAFDQAVGKSNAPAVDLQGWHTASTVAFDTMNKAIVAQKASPANFAHKMPASDDYSVEGTFGEWALTAGGEGDLIQISAAISSGVIVHAGVKHNLKPSTVVVQIKAKFLAHSGDSNQSDVVPDVAEPVTIVSWNPPLKKTPGYTGPVQFDDEMLAAAYESLLQDWFNENRAAYQPLFATVDIGAKYDLKAVEWMKPSYTGYAVNSPNSASDPHSSTFAVTTLLDSERPPAALSFQVSPYARPQGADASFVLSRGKFLEHMMLPAVPYMFAGAQQSDFEIGNLQSEIRNVKSLTLIKTKLSNGDLVDPVVDPGKFTLSLDGQYLKIDLVDISFPAEGLFGIGQTVKLNYSCRYRMSLDDQGTIALSAADANASISSHLEEAEWLFITKLAFIGVTSLLGIVTLGAGAAAWAVGRAAAAGAVGVAEGAEAAEAAGTTLATVRSGVQTATGMASLGASAASLSTVVSASSEATEMAGNLVQLSRAARVGLELSKLGLPFKTIAAVAGGTSALLGVFGGAVEIGELLNEKGYTSAKVDFLSGMQNAIQKTVIWPKDIGELNISSVELRDSLVFGFKQKA